MKNEEDFRPFLRLNFWLFFSEKMTPMAGTLRWTLNGGNTATGSWPIGTRARASPISGLILSISLGLAPPSKDNPRLICIEMCFRLTGKKNPLYGWECLETKRFYYPIYILTKKRISLQIFKDFSRICVPKLKMCWKKNREIEVKFFFVQFELG